LSSWGPKEIRWLLAGRQNKEQLLPLSSQAVLAHPVYASWDVTVIPVFYKALFLESRKASIFQVSHNI
jgi:hypothetical protein